ncbi:hypothetical protein GQ53DRAFT_879171, partial [Thozetella sp. PMI_491]
MDPVSLIASAVALFQLSQYGVKFATRIIQIAGDSGLIGDEVLRFAKKVKGFSHEIGLAHLVLESHFKRHRDSQVTAYISEHNIFGDLNQKSIQLKSGLRETRDSLIPRGNGLFDKVLAVLKWMHQKPIIGDLVQEMESVKASVTILMGAAQLEACSIAAKETDDEAERKWLRKQM